MTFRVRSRPDSVWAGFNPNLEQLVLERIGEVVTYPDEKAVLGTWQVVSAVGALEAPPEFRAAQFRRPSGNHRSGTQRTDHVGRIDHSRCDTSRTGRQRRHASGRSSEEALDSAEPTGRTFPVCDRRATQSDQSLAAVRKAVSWHLSTAGKSAHDSIGWRRTRLISSQMRPETTK